MKVLVDGKEFFDIDINDIPETINITKDTLWNDKWGLFAICCLLSGDVKMNMESVKEIKEKLEIEK